LEPWHSIEKSGEPSDAAWRSGGFDGTSRQGQGKTLDFPAVWRLPPQKGTLLFRFTIIWESMIVIIREKRAEVIEIIWERVEPRAA
jgi:hypothetical protein